MQADSAAQVWQREVPPAFHGLGDNRVPYIFSFLYSYMISEVSKTALWNVSFRIWRGFFRRPKEEQQQASRCIGQLIRSVEVELRQVILPNESCNKGSGIIANPKKLNGVDRVNIQRRHVALLRCPERCQRARRHELE